MMNTCVVRVSSLLLQKHISFSEAAVLAFRIYTAFSLASEQNKDASYFIFIEFFWIFLLLPFSVCVCFGTREIKK